ncbi:hypothetical protein M5U04_01715 [Xenorhabdus sp. XENO-1]|uniref:hypothetical protein n=1 Tax=Xenorhabdus bovienii TaxID=40576 RepID=UPI0020CA84CE|nr:hypothetical protein [Xenorhabdus bovienii]MCP9266846.1 hypothetical protein [Xenorhabdus bovienii subsp. africana]
MGMVIGIIGIMLLPSLLIFGVAFFSHRKNKDTASAIIAVVSGIWSAILLYQFVTCFYVIGFFR